DLFLSDYNPLLKTIEISAYTWANSMYHFSDGARLENRNGGADKIVLTGPINGDDHFYVVDLQDDNWRTDARKICCSGKFAEVEQNLDKLANGIKQFSGTVAEDNEPIWYVDYFASYLGWPMTPENIELHAQAIYDAEQEWYDKIGGRANYHSSRIRFAASVNATVYGTSNQCKDPDITAEGMVNFCRALAKKGAYFSLKIGHGSHLYMPPETLADCYEASIVDGECYMMARTRELAYPIYFDSYKPHLNALLARAKALGQAPPKVMLCAKGAMFSAMLQEQGDEYFPKYKDILVPGVENSNVTVLEWSLAERVGLWMNGDVKCWGCNVIGDNLAANRVAEWGGMRNAHVVLRQLLSQYALGARVFRVTSVTGLDNPMFVRGDVTGEDQKWSQPYQKGVLNFLKIVEKGIYPHSPETEQIKGISHVSVALYNRSERLLEQSLKHDYYKYLPENENYVFNKLACWNAYTDIPATDVTSFVYGTKRRWDNLFPATPGGFVTIVPSKSATQLEANDWCKQSYQTNGDTWSDFSVEAAKEIISNKVLAQRDSLDFYVDGECFWQVTQDKDDSLTYFIVVMGNSVLTPVKRTVKLKAGKNMKGNWNVYDQLSGTPNEAIGTISSNSGNLTLSIPAGTPRLLCIKLALSTGIFQPKSERLKVYPNPAQQKLNIEVKERVNEDALVTIYNSFGKAIKYSSQKDYKMSVDVSSWASGMYLVCLCRKGENEIKKVIVN
ncbi:MAG: T9SS type A sorting domain-containing protein, partial [Prolixibacteraceae bacterium]|nr:T9SS type A sorting domain-containing protein [Prolixibacteraceae bacterium]